MLSALLMNGGTESTQSGSLVEFAADGKTGTSTTSHTINDVPAGAFLVLSTGMTLGGGLNPTIQSTPSLTWTKRADGDGASGSAEIYTATFTDGGNITVTSNWGSGRYQSSYLRVFLNAEATFAGSTAAAAQQIQPLVNISTTRFGSKLICITSDWNGETGDIIYRGSATEDYYSHDDDEASIYHYSYDPFLISSYQVGMTSPDEFDGKSTAVIEVRATAAAPVGDVTPPSKPTLTLVNTTSSSMSISWTASTDNVGVTGYEVYLNNVLITTKTTLNHTFSGLSSNTIYEAYVRAKDAAGNGNNSNIVSGFTGTGGSGSLSPFTMTEIPYSDPDIITYGRGAEQWHYPCTSSSGCNGAQWDRISNPTTANPQWVENSKNVYHRFQWTQIEGATQGSYTWEYLDSRIRSAIDKKQMISFGIMTVYEGAPGGRVSLSGINGATCSNTSAMSSYPKYIHDAMQASGCSQCDWVASGSWIPNWNHSAYINGLTTLHTAIRNHLLNTYYNGVRFADVVFCIDIRGYGQYGEWHSGSICDWDDYPTNRQPTANTLKSIINTHTQVFDQWPLVMMVAGYNALPGGSGISLFHPYSEVAHYALDATNAWGKVGYRRDQVIATDNYLHQLLAGNTNKLNDTGLTVGEKFLNLWKLAPGTGEPLPGAFDNHDTNVLDANIQLYHHASFGNGNYPGNSISAADNTSTKANHVRAAFKRCGFRLKITSGQAPLTIVRGTPFQIKMKWINVGVACVYEDWQVRYELQNGSGVAVWTGVSSKVLKLFRPDEGEVETTDTFVITNSTPIGNYKLVVKVVDPKGYKDNLLLAIQPVNADSSYTIFNSVTVNSAT